MHPQLFLNPTLIKCSYCSLKSTINHNKIDGFWLHIYDFYYYTEAKVSLSNVYLLW